VPYHIADHILQEARQVASPNYNDRPDGRAISLLVIHNISLPPGQYGGPYIEQLFTNQLDAKEHPYFAEIAGLEVSAHVLIRRDGEVIQFVPFNKRAWHAGRSCFHEETECNDFSIGIELEGCDDEPFETIQYEKLAAIAQQLMHTYPDISAERITGHSDIAPGRKTDPGPFFDWAVFQQQLLHTPTLANNESST